MKNLQLATVLLAGALVLTGCNNQSKSNTAATSQTTSDHSVSRQSSSSQVIKQSSEAKQSMSSKESAPTALWDSHKDTQLKTFIDQWAPTMDQTYTEYDGQTPLKTSTGTVYPTDLAQATVAGATGVLGWSENGLGSYTYNVVAIYNYDGTHPPLPNHITYLFAFHNGQPIVLVDQSRDGAPILTETKNAQVQANFTQIASSTSN